MDGSEKEIKQLQARIADLEKSLAEHTNAEADAIRLSDDGIRRITNAIPAIVYTYQLRPDGSQKLTFISQAVKAIFGLLPSEVIEDFYRLWGMILPEDADRVYASIMDSAKAHTPWMYDFRIKMADGRIKWIHGESSPEEARNDGIVVWNGTLMDITDRKKAEQALADSEIRFKTLFDEVWDGIILADTETKQFAMCNRMICDTLGYSQAEMLSMKVSDIHPENDRMYIEGKFDELLKGKSGVATDIPVQRKDGTIFYADITTTRVTLGRRHFLMGTFHDTTIRKQISDSLKKSGEYLNKIINLIADPVFVKDREHRWVLLNDAYCQFMGYSREELIGKSDYDYFPKKEADVFWEKDEIVFAHGAENVNEEAFTDAKGITHAIITKKTLYFDQEGRKLIVGVIRDVTEIRKIQESLRETSQFLNSIIENIPNMVFVKDAKDLRFVRMNRAGAELLGIPLEELMGKNDYDFFPKEQADFFVAKDREAMSLGIVEDVPRETIRTRFKGDRILHTKKVTLRDSDGNPQYLMGISEDVTDREHAEEALRKYAREVSDLYNNAPCGYHSLDENGTIVQMNDTELKWLGYERAELIGLKRFPDLLTEESQKVFHVQFPLFKKQGWIAGIEFDVIRKNGSIFPILLNATAIRSAEGRFIMSRSTMIDITERKLIEAELRKYQGNLEDLVKKRTVELEAEIHERKKTEELLRLSENRYQIVTERTGQVIYDCDLERGRFDWAGAIEEVTGYTPDEFRSVDVVQWQALIHPEDRAHALHTFEDTQMEAGRYFVVYRLKTKQDPPRDAYIYIEDRGVFLQDHRGKVCRRLGSLKDITERRKAEVALRESEAQYRALVETTGTGFVVINTEGKVVAANQEYVRMSGHSKLIEIYGRSVLEWTAEHERMRNQEAVEKCVREGSLRNFEVDYVDRDGKVTPVEINATVVETAGVQRILTLCRDITERKNREEVKTELISMVSHELRTPLVPIREGICMLLEGLTGPVTEEQKDILSSSKANIDRLISLVNNFLDFQKIEAGVIHLRIEKVNLNSLARQVFAEGEQLLQSRNLNFKLVLDEDLPDVECDPSLIMRVATNLLHNAVRFTRKGKVTIKTSCLNSTVKFSVCDTGIGIKKEDIPNLFRKFNQLADGKDVIQGGTGLGLAISKRIIEQHHGAIGVESEFGKGSIFYFTLNILSA
jgi:PAS domain S-box-containing protein